MNRSFTKNVIVLSLKPLGENNSSVTLITDSNEILYATLYGGPKSKLKSLVTQYNSGKMWFYENPEKNQIKITDFEVKIYHSSFTTNLFKIYAANLASELAIKTRCAGNNSDFFKFFSGFFDGMDLCNEEQSRLGLLRFLWRFIILSGVQPLTSECEQCGTSFFTQKFEMNGISYYNVIDNCFVCSDCFTNSFGNINHTSDFIPVNISSVRYLDGIVNLAPAEVRKLKISQEDYEQLRQLIFFLVQKTVDSKLNSLETGIGIL